MEELIKNELYQRCLSLTISCLAILVNLRRPLKLVVHSNFCKCFISEAAVRGRCHVTISMKILLPSENGLYDTKINILKFKKKKYLVISHIVFAINYDLTAFHSLLCAVMALN